MKAKTRTRQEVIADLQSIWLRADLGAFSADSHEREVERLTALSKRKYHDELQRYTALARATWLVAYELGRAR